MLAIVRSAAALIDTRVRRRWVAVSWLALAVGVVEGGAAGSVYLLIRVLQDPGSWSTFPLADVMAPLFTGASETGIILRWAGIVAAYHVAKNVLLVGHASLRESVLAAAHADVSRRVLRGYLRLPYVFHFRRHSSELIRNATGAVDEVISVLNAVDILVREALIAVALVGVLLVAAPGITLAVGAVLGVMVTGLLRATRSVADRRGRQHHALQATIYQTIQEALGGIKDLKVLGREQFFLDRLAATQRAKMSLARLGLVLVMVPSVVVETAFVVSALALAAMVALQPGMREQVLPIVGVFAYAAFRAIPMATRVVHRTNDIRVAGAAVQTLTADLALIDAAADRESDGAGPPLTLHHALHLRHVSYRYPEAAHDSVSDVSLTVPRGQSLGIIGSTGAGKSTLVDLIVGLLTPSQGEILVDEAPLRGHERRWRPHIGYVQQAVFLRDDTLRRNVAFAIDDDEIDVAAAQRAYAIAHLDALIATWPQGDQTCLGERGVRLSGGERQRVAIARALYHDPEVLVFDEATSALDNVTEAEVTRAIESLRGRKTMLVVAHRLSTVRRCDRIVYLDNGAVLAAGTYEELMGHPRFRALVEAGDWIR